jgi:hypothetical protein
MRATMSFSSLTLTSGSWCRSVMTQLAPDLCRMQYRFHWLCRRREINLLCETGNAAKRAMSFSYQRLMTLNRSGLEGFEAGICC